MELITQDERGFVLRQDDVAAHLDTLKGPVRDEIGSDIVISRDRRAVYRIAPDGSRRRINERQMVNYCLDLLRTMQSEALARAEFELLKAAA